MASRLRSLLQSPTFEDAEKTYRASLLYAILLACLGAIGFIYLMYPVIAPGMMERLLSLTLTLPFLVGVVLLVRKGHVQIASAAFVAIIWLLITVNSITGGGIHSPSFSAYIIPVIIAGFLLGWRVGAVGAGLTICVGALFVIAEESGWRHSDASYGMSGILVLQAAIIVVGTTIIGLADRHGRRALAQARFNEHRFHQAFENAPIGMALVDLNGRILKVNQALCDILGYSREQLEATTVPAITHPDDVPREADARQTQGSYSMEKRYIHADGHVVWGRLSSSMVLDAHGKPLYRVGQLDDVTQRRLAEARVQKLNRIYVVLSNINQAIVRTRDLTTLYRQACQIAIRDGKFLTTLIAMFDASSGTLQPIASASVRTDGNDLLPLDLRTALVNSQDAMKTLRQGRAVIINDIENDPSATSWRDQALRLGHRAIAAFPLQVDSQIRGVIVLLSGEAQFFDTEELDLLDELALDISFAIEVSEKDARRQRAEDLVRQNEERYRRLSEDMPAMICTFLPDSTLTYVNAAYCEYFKKSSEDLIGKRFIDFIPDEEERESTRRHYMSLSLERPSKTYAHPVIAPDGTSRWQQWTDRAFFDQDGQIVSFQSFGVDITERRRAEDALRQSEEQYRSLINSLDDLVFALDTKSVITFVSRACLRLAGYDPSEVIGRNLSEFLHPEDAPILITTYLRRMQQSPDASLRTTIPEMEGRFLKRNGDHFWMTMRGTVIRDSEGKAIEFRGILHDITARKQAEARRLETEMLRFELQKERELGELRTRFVSMVSHEFRTPLASILLSSELLRTYADRLSEARRRDHLATIQNQVRHMETLVEDTLFISRAEMGRIHVNLTKVDLDAYCEELVQDYRNLTGTHEIIYTCLGQCNHVAIDISLLRQILMNLLSNATKYSLPGSEVHLDLACDHEAVIIRVKDSGIGIPEEDQKRLFEPFHRAANVGDVSGTGLGLAVVKRSVDAHHGNIRVESKENAGTTFIIRIPLDQRNED